MSDIARWKRVRGNVNDTVVMAATGVTNPQDATWIGRVWLPNVVDHPGVTLAASYAAGAFTVQLGGPTGWLATAAVGAWLLRIEGTFSGGGAAPLSIPEGAPGVIEVSL